MILTQVIEVEPDESSVSAASIRGQIPQPVADLWRQSILTGNWEGARDEIADSGLSVALGYKADVIANVSGGLSRSSSFMHNVDLVIGVDAEKLFNWTRASFLVHAMNNGGVRSSSNLGQL